MPDSITPRVIGLLLATALLSCGGPDGETPHAGSTSSAPARLTGEAKVALDSGNVLFRAKAYDLALAQYRRSALLAPGDVTPLFGVLMVGEATRNSRLADSARARIRELNPSLADSTSRGHAELIDQHSRITTTPPSPH